MTACVVPVADDVTGIAVTLKNPRRTA